MLPTTPVDSAPRPDPMDQIERMQSLRDDPEKLRKAARGFEAMVLAELMRPLENSGGGLLGKSMGSRFAKGMFHDAIVQKVADAGGIGLADMVLKQVTQTSALGAYRDFAAPQGAWPIQGGDPTSICSGFGVRSDPFTGEARMHKGIDIDAELGTPVFPVRDGKVIFAGSRGGYGKLVIVEHEDGLQSRYGHLSEIDVAEGDWLDGSGALGAVGSTGRSTGPHLHLEVRQGDVALDPMEFLH